MPIDRRPIYPLGVRVAQTWQQFALHIEAIQEHKIRLFVELGVFQGGFAAFLMTYGTWTALDYCGVEVDINKVDQRIRDRANIIYGDCLSEFVQQAIGFKIAQTDGPALIFCDNGNKPAELETYSKLLRPGDYIAVHDYGTEIKAHHLRRLGDGFREIDKEYRRKAKMPMFQRVDK